MKANKLTKTLSFLVAFAMVFTMMPLSIFAKTDVNIQAEEQIVTSGSTAYYKADGTAGSNTAYDVSIAKTVAATGTENLFNVTVNVTYKNATTTVTSAPAATTLVIDTSGSMAWCSECGKDESAHHTFVDNGTYGWQWKNTSYGRRYVLTKISDTPDGLCDHVSGGGPNASVCGLTAAEHHTFTSRLAAAKASAIAFLDAYAASANGKARMVSLVTFASSTTKQDLSSAIGNQYWVDVSVAANLTYVKSIINNLSANGSTYTSGAMNDAADLLDTDTYKTAIGSISNRFCVLLTDGEPTVCVVDNNGGDTSSWDTYYTQIGCAAVTATGASIYAIAYGLSDATVPVLGETSDMAISTWLTSKCGATAVYTPSSATGLNDAFAAILNSAVTSGSTGTSVTDAIDPAATVGDKVAGKVAGFESFISANGATEASGAISWDLGSAAADTTGVAPGYTSYTMSYKIKLDNTQSSFISNYNYSLAAASFTYTDASNSNSATNSHTAVSQQPVIKGYLGSVSFTKVNVNNTAIENAMFRLYDSNNSVISTATSNAEGHVTFSRIPSGASYTIKETSVGLDYTVNTATSEVAVAYGDATVTGALIANNKVTDARDPKNATFTVTKTWLPATNNGQEITASIYSYTVSGDSNEKVLAATAAATLTLNSANSFTASTTLPTVDVATGNAINYTVTESTSDNYRLVSNTGFVKGTDGNYACTLKNVSTENTSIIVAKNWVCPDNYKTPVTIRLYQNGSKYEDYTFSGSTWSQPVSVPTWDNNGAAYSYTVAEIVNGRDYTTGTVNLGGHDFTVSVSGTTVTNTISQQYTAVSGTKTWNVAALTESEKAALTATITLTGSNGSTDTTNVTVASPAYSFNPLPMYNLTTGALITYSVAETATGGGNIVSSQTGNDFTNTLTDTTSIPVVKIWADNYDALELRPNSVTVKVMNGSTVAGTYDLNAENNWAHTFTGLQKYDASGALINYTVVEAGLDANGRMAVGTDGANWYASTQATTADGVTITNTLGGTHKTVTVTKTWVDDKTNDTRTAEADITLTGSDGSTNNWTTSINGSHEFTVPAFDSNGAEITYTASEAAVSGYTTAQSGFDFTNTITQVYDVTVSGHKTWVGGGDHPEITFHLYQNGTEVASTSTLDENGNFSFTQRARYNLTTGQPYSYTVTETMTGSAALLARYGYNGTAITGTKDNNGVWQFTNTFTNGTVTVSGTKTWLPASVTDKVTVGLYEGDKLVKTAETVNLAYSFTDLPQYNSDGTAKTYTVYEMNGETPVKSGSITVGGSEYVVSYTGNNITNTLKQDHVTVSVTKTWNGPAASSVTFELLRNGQSMTPAVTLTLTAGDNWTGTFPQQDKYDSARSAYTYSVVEQGVTENNTVTLGGNTYTVAKNGNVFTNTIVDPMDASLTVTKSWSEGSTPETVTVQLYADGALVQGKTAELSERGDWTYTFTGLPVYDSTTYNKVTYTVKELDKNGNAVNNGGTVALANGAQRYTVTYGTSDGAAVITNTFKDADSYKYKVYRHYVSTIDGAVTTADDDDANWTAISVNDVTTIDASKWLAYNGRTYTYAGGYINGGESSANPTVTFTATKTADGANTWEIHLNYTYTYNTPYNPPVIVTYTVTVNYLNQADNSVLAQPHSETHREYTSYDVTAYDKIAIEGYTYAATSGDQLTGTLNGNKVINVYYTVNEPVIIPDEPTPGGDKPVTPTTPTTPTEPTNPGTEIIDDNTPMGNLPNTGAPADVIDPVTTLGLVALILSMLAAGLGITHNGRRKDEDDAQ